MTCVHGLLPASGVEGGSSLFWGGLADCKGPHSRQSFITSFVSQESREATHRNHGTTARKLSEVASSKPARRTLSVTGKERWPFHSVGHRCGFVVENTDSVHMCAVHACCCEVPHVLSPPVTRGRTQGASWARPGPQQEAHVSLTSLNLWATEHRSPGDAADQQCPRGDQGVCSLSHTESRRDWE